jgi:hypothetical protein
MARPKDDEIAAVEGVHTDHGKPLGERRDGRIDEPDARVHVAGHQLRSPQEVDRIQVGDRPRAADDASMAAAAARRERSKNATSGNTTMGGRCGTLDPMARHPPVVMRRMRPVDGPWVALVSMMAATAGVKSVKGL